MEKNTDDAKGFIAAAMERLGEVLKPKAPPTPDELVERAETKIAAGRPLSPAEFQAREASLEITAAVQQHEQFVEDAIPSHGLGVSFPERIDHPPHYGGADDPFEAIKVIEAWGLNFNLGNTIKYIRRSPDKGSLVEDLKKARWYLDREISLLEDFER